MSDPLSRGVAASNPWRRAALAPERAMLLALSFEPQPVPALAAKAGLDETAALAALQRLQREHFAIADGDGYELTGPLSWFGDFASAIAYYARRNFVVAADGEPDSHLYVCDIRVKNVRPVGDPLTETAGVLACGKTARTVTLARDHAVPTCEDCRNALTP